IAVINQETVMVGSSAPQSYPMFNTPTQMAKCLADVGFDVASIATNHSLDMMSSGLIDTLDLLNDTPGIIPVGAYHSRDEYYDFQIITVNDIKFAFVCYVEHTNGITLPDDKQDYLIYWDETDDVKNQIEQARQAADAVVVCMHGGTEYSDSENETQREFAQLCADAGATCIIGTHPHTLQPVDVLRSSDGRDVPVMYSLGNLVSAQDTSFKRMTGGIVNLTFTKDFSTGEVTVSKPVMDISVTHYGYGFSNVKIYTLGQYTDALAKAHGIADMSIRNLYNHVQTVIGDEYLLEDYRSTKASFD
ncbi:MAG: CapA family protein, partial [Clostridia bacterium]|nr:CapA family protein [Clostridia bacterium]